MSFHALDYTVVVVYFLLVQYIGLVVARRRAQKVAGEFILAGRSLTLPLFVATLVATWYGSILGVGEFVYTSGIVAWVCFALPYYLAAGAFAWLLAGKVRTMNAETIPDHFARAYGLRAGVVASFLVLVITIPAPYVLMLGVILQLFTGWSLPLCIVVGAVLSIVYIYKGGFRADVYANALQFVLMYAGFIVLLVFSAAQFGGPGDMAARLPEGHFDPTGGNSWQYIAVWFIIAFQTFVDPSFHQRCAAARTPAIARRGVVVSIGFWMVFDAMTLLSGLYARAFLSPEQPLMAYPALADTVLPAAFKGLFVVALLATVMSTLDSYGFLSAVTIGRDIAGALAERRKRTMTEEQVEVWVRRGIVIMAAASVVPAVVFPSVVDLIYLAASVAVPGLLLPLVVGYSRRFTLARGKVMLIIALPALLSLLWIGAGSAGDALGPAAAVVAALEPMVAGIALSVVLTVAFLRRREAVTTSVSVAPEQAPREGNSL